MPIGTIGAGNGPRDLPAVMQDLKPEPRIMRDELSDYEWTAIKPMLPNKPQGVRRATSWVAIF